MRAPILSALAVLVVALPPAHAESAGEKGLRIIAAARQSHAGFGDSSVEITMVQRFRQGERSVRRLRRQVVEVADGSRSLLIFDAPAEVSGTAFLTVAGTAGPNEQWLYLPALRRGKHIRARGGRGTILPAELSYLDPLAEPGAGTSYRWERDEICADGLDCWVLEARPADASVGQARHLVWIDKAAYRVRKIELYDRAGMLHMSFAFADYELHRGRHWRPAKLSVVSHRTGTSTVFTFENYAFATGLTDLGRDTIARIAAPKRAVGGRYD